MESLVNGENNIEKKRRLNQRPCSREYKLERDDRRNKVNYERPFSVGGQ
jgi:hypothetical protein